MNEAQIATTTFAHEVGHALGLSHTHESYKGKWENNHLAKSCQQEKVDRNAQNNFWDCGNSKTNCLWYGDGLCDTDADPKLEIANVQENPSTLNWEYIGGGTDKDGDPWNPPIFNIMSYSRPEVRSLFSKSQRGIMYSNLFHPLVSGFSLHNGNLFIDVYEPDNENISYANEILNYNATQHRGLHRDIHGNNGATNTYSYCDKDIMYFSVPYGQTYKVNLYTEAVTGKKQVDTELTVFDASGVVVATNDDITPSDKYAGIYELTLSGGEYWVQVNSSSNASNSSDRYGEYYITLERCAGVCCYNNLIGSATTVDNVSGPFNLALRNSGVEEYLGNSLTITDKLYFNHSSSLGFGGVPGSPIHSSHLEAIVCNNAEIVIENGGEMILGNLATNQTTEVHFQSGTILRIKDGGKLIVRDGSKLIIEDGANFIFEDGAQVELQDYHTNITFNGKLTIEDNADFRITGLGKLIFDQDVKWAINASGNHYLKLDEYWDIGTNTTFRLEGPSTLNQNHNLIEVYKPVYFKMEDGSTFDQVTLKNGRVALHEDALLFSFSPTNLRFVKFESAYSWQKHAGFRLWNNTGPNAIFGCKFYDGKPSALMHWVGGGSPITFTACDFDNNTTGLEVQGGNFKLIGCDFNDNYQAVHAVNLTGQSFIHNSKVIGSNNAFHDGVHTHAQNGASLTITSSEFTNCIDGLSLGADMNARVSCSEFTLNGRYGILAATSSSLDIGSEAENIFIGNQWDDIYLTGDHEKSAIYMDEGGNDFAARGYQGGSYLQGRFSNGAPVFLGGSNQIAANNNKMPTYNLGTQTYMPVDFTYKLTPGGNSTKVTLDIPTNLTSIQRSCNSSILNTPSHTGYYRLVASFPFDGGFISNLYYLNTDLKTAALDAIDRVSFGEDMRNDDEALVRLTSILSSQISSPDIYTERIRSAVYQQMHQALSNAYQNGGLINVQGEDPNGVNDSVENVINVIDQFLADLDPNDSTQHFLDFKYHLDKAHAYRVAGYYDQALLVLQSSSSWTYNSDQIKQAGYWECVCEAENEYFNDELPEEEYAYQIELCNNQFYGNNYKRIGTNSSENNAYAIDPKVDMNSIVLFPQPVIDELTLEISNSFEGDVSFVVSDIRGRIIKEGLWNWRGTSQDLNVSLLSTGVYFIRLQFGNQPDKTIKFVKD